MFNKLKEAKDFAISKQLERNQAELKGLNSVLATVTEYVSGNDYSEFSKVYAGIPESLRKRIHKFISEPTLDNWDDVAHIVIRSSIMLTIWQAVILTTPGFPRRGRAYNEFNKVVGEWASIPSREEFINAIRYAVFFASDMKLQEEMYQIY